MGSTTRVLAFGAHPDDLEVGAGGLLARLVQQGAKVVAAVMSLPTLLAERSAEARRGAAVLGVELALMNHTNKLRVEDIPMHQLVAQMDMLVGDVRPDIVITHSAHDLHWDHGLVNRATISALRRWPCNVLAYLSSYEMNVQVSARGRAVLRRHHLDHRSKGGGDLGPRLAAGEDGRGVDARSGARDGPPRRRRICRSLRSPATALLTEMR